MGSSLSHFFRGVPPIFKLQGVPLAKGEQNMDLLLISKGELYRYDREGGEWKDRGIGTLKLLRDKETGEVWLVMYHNKTLRTILNNLVLPTMKFHEHDQSKRICFWSAVDFAVVEPKSETFGVRFTSTKHCKDFCDKIEQITKALANEDEAQVAPIFKIQGVPVPKGEENMDLLLISTGELYRYDQEGGEWKDRGIGTLKLLRDKETGEVWLVMYHNKTLRTILNNFVLPTMKIHGHPQSKRICVWSAVDFAIVEPKSETFGVRFTSTKRCEEFQDKIEQITKLQTQKKLIEKITAFFGFNLPSQIFVFEAMMKFCSLGREALLFLRWEYIACICVAMVIWSLPG